MKNTLMGIEAEPWVAYIPSTMQDVNSLIAQSRMGIDTALVSIQTALGKINDIDIDSLNQAIADLAGIVRPLSALLGRR